MEGFPHNASTASGADAPEAVRSTAHAGSDTAPDQSIPDPTAASPEQSVQAGPLSLLSLMNSKDPIEILQVLEDVAELISARVLREVRAFRRELDVHLDAIETRLDAIETRSEAWRDIQDARIDALYKLYEGLQKQTRLLVALFAFQFFFLGALTTVSLMDWFGVSAIFKCPVLAIFKCPLFRSS